MGGSETPKRPDEIGQWAAAIIRKKPPAGRRAWQTAVLTHRRDDRRPTLGTRQLTRSLASGSTVMPPTAFKQPRTNPIAAAMAKEAVKGGAAVGAPKVAASGTSAQPRLVVAFAPPAHARPGVMGNVVVPDGRKFSVRMPGPGDVSTDGMFYAEFVGERHIGFVSAPTGAAAVVAKVKRARKASTASQEAQSHKLADVIDNDACYGSFNEGFSTDGRPIQWSGQSKHARRQKRKGETAQQ